MKAPEIKHYINWLGRVEYRNINCSFTYDENGRQRSTSSMR